MCESRNLYGLPDLPAAPVQQAKPQPPLTRRQLGMFEKWECIGLSGLFTPDQTKGTDHESE